MYNNSGYVTDGDWDEVEERLPLSVNSCGNYRLMTVERYETIRPGGRRDYQLIYVAGGKASFTGKKGELVLSEGNAFIYHPGETQQYSYELAEHPDIFWLHYSGKEAELLSEKLESGGKACCVGTSTEYRRLFERMIREMQIRRSGYRELCAAYAVELLLLMIRSVEETSEDAPPRNRRIEKVIEQMYQEYAKSWSVEEYARLCNMGVCWFIRSFRTAVGCSPQQFVIQLRVGKAKELLADTSYNISEISTLVGYENPLYFSRMFRKSTGYAPTQYRKLKSSGSQ